MNDELTLKELRKEYEILCKQIKANLDMFTNRTGITIEEINLYMDKDYIDGKEIERGYRVTPIFLWNQVLLEDRVET